MRILLTNDDGIHAPGLGALIKAFSNRHQVTVVAPDRERSAVGHAITLHRPICLEKIGNNGNRNCFAVSGTPADCVKLGLAELLEAPPELVVAGINPGANVGVNLSYSGTVAAAKEAAMAGIPAMAVSIIAPGDRHLDAAAHFAERLARQVAARGLPEGTFLNVNLPDQSMERIRGVRWSRQATGVFTQQFEKRRDPRDRIYYWQGGDGQGTYDEPDIDAAALNAHYISVTPVKCDMTDHDTLRELTHWEISLNP
jgi:5'-nucleotidase